MATPADHDRPSSLLIGAADVARLLSCNRATLWRWHSSGRLGPLPVRIGRPKWRRAELESWVASGCPPRCRWAWPAARETGA